eukprot:g15106.t1
MGRALLAAEHNDLGGSLDIEVHGYGSSAAEGASVGGAPSRFYHYADATESSNSVTPEIRKFLQACRTDVEEVRALLDAGADVYQANANGFSGLHMAVSNLQTDVAQLLLERGHDVNVMEANGFTPLDYCVDAGFSAAEIGGADLEFLQSISPALFAMPRPNVSADQRDADETDTKPTAKDNNDMVNDSFNLSTHKKALKLFCREREGEYIQAGGQAAMCLHASVYILCQELVDSFQSHIHGLTAVFNQLLCQSPDFEKMSFEAVCAHQAPLCLAMGKDQLVKPRKEQPNSHKVHDEFDLCSSPVSAQASEKSVLSDKSIDLLEQQYERLDQDCAGKLSFNDLRKVVHEFGNGWEMEDLPGLLEAAQDLLKKEKLVANPSFKNRSATGIKADRSLADFETFKALATHECLLSDEHLDVTVRNDAKILRNALDAEQVFNRYLPDGHLEKDEAVAATTESRWQQQVINVIVVGISVDMQKTDPDNPIWQALEIVFLTFYFFEAMGKILVFGCHWNIFDFGCLLLSLGDLGIYIYVTVSQVDNFLNLHTLMLVKMVRLARLARLIRTLRFAIFYELKLMVLGVISGMRVLAWAMVLLVVLIFAAAIFFTSMFGESCLELRSVRFSMFTLFRCFTDGCVDYEGKPLSEKLHEIYGLWFVIPYVFLFVGDRTFLHVLKDADIETANESGIYEVLDADMSNSLSIEEVYNGLMRLRGPIAKSEIVGLILRLQHATTLLTEMESRKRSS